MPLTPVIADLQLQARLLRATTDHILTLIEAQLWTAAHAADEARQLLADLKSLRAHRVRSQMVADLGMPDNFRGPRRNAAALRQATTSIIAALDYWDKVGFPEYVNLLACDLSY